MKFELVTSKSVLKALESPVSLHKAGCGGAKREAQRCSGSIFPVKAENLEDAKKEAFIEGGLEECGYALEDLAVHSCCRNAKEVPKRDSEMTDVEMSDWLRGKDLNERLWGGDIR